MSTYFQERAKIAMERAEKKKSKKKIAPPKPKSAPSQKVIGNYRKQPTARLIVECVCEATQVKEDNLYSFKRKKIFCLARALVAFFLRETLGWPPKEIANYLGRERATYYNMMKAFDNRLWTYEVRAYVLDTNRRIADAVSPEFRAGTGLAYVTYACTTDESKRQMEEKTGCSEIL